MGTSKLSLSSIETSLFVECVAKTENLVVKSKAKNLSSRITPYYFYADEITEKVWPLKNQRRDFST